MNRRSRPKPRVEPVEAEQAQPEDSPPPTGVIEMAKDDLELSGEVGVFKAQCSVTVGNQVQNTLEFGEYVIPVEIIREYRTFVETGFAAVLAKASIVILSNTSPDVTGLMAATPAAVRSVLEG